VNSRLGEIAIIGGGCYGTFYAGQLAEARDRGKIEYERVLVVDRDPDCQASRELPPREDRTVVIEEWDPFLDRFPNYKSTNVQCHRSHAGILKRLKNKSQHKDKLVSKTAFCVKF
jgi:hypothetical protein